METDAMTRPLSLAEAFALAHYNAGHRYFVEADGGAVLCECGEHVGYPDSPDALIFPSQLPSRPHKSDDLRTPAESKVVDLMAALEDSIAEASRVRDARRTRASTEGDARGRSDA